MLNDAVHMFIVVENVFVHLFAIFFILIFTDILICMYIYSFVGNFRRRIEIIPDVFVIEVSFSVCSGTVYTTNKQR